MSRAEELLDTTLAGKYRVESVVTEHAEYFVFAGRESGGAPVTIRMARPLRGMSPEELEAAHVAFTGEAEQLTRLVKASASIEQLLAFGETLGPTDRERLAYCIFARTDGSSLAQMRGRGAQPIGRAITALAPVAEALAAAHAEGFCHGDVRPDNLILVEAAYRPSIKLIRFALATRLGGGTRTFAPEYGAPEHFKRGEKHLGPATDVYGLALCLVEIATGRPPLEGSHPTELYKQTTDITRRPTLKNRGLPVSDAIEGVVAKALAVNPKLRWANAGDFWAALVTAAEKELREESEPGEVGGDKTSSPAVAPTPAGGTKSVRAKAAPDGDPKARRLRVGIAVGIGVGFGFFFLLVALLLAPKRTRSTSPTDATSTGPP
jgi:eukaryotic-like serine/threonine-protein kinase